MPLATEPETPAQSPWQRTRIRVPREDGATLAIPALSQATRLAEENAATLAATEACILDRPVCELRDQARQEVFEAACDFTERLSGENPVGDARGGFIITGHQPELFHPGVWVKNLAATEIARRCGVTGLNLVVDNDLQNSTRIRVPAGSRDRPRLEFVAFDRPQPARPWEDSRIEDGNSFAAFGDQVTQRLEPWDFRPILADWWADAVAHAHNSDNPGKCLTAPRLRLERALGFGNLELPISELSTIPSFSLFAVHILSRIDRFHSVYNQTLAEYRKVNRIRSRTHPVPELVETGGLFEAPFWIWRRGESQRQRVFVQHDGNTVRVFDRPDADTFVLDFPRETADPGAVLQRLDADVRFRPRALTTTLFARLFLADLFVHGIGGSKYDEMTNRILLRFYGVTPPGYLTLSTTARLPTAAPFDETEADLSRIRCQQRELMHNPQRFVDSTNSDVSALIAEKKQLIADQQAADGQRRQGIRPAVGSRSGLTRYRRFPEINRQLAGFARRSLMDLRVEESLIRDRLAANTILNSREFPFWLYPQERIQRMVDDLKQQFDA